MHFSETSQHDVYQKSTTSQSTIAFIMAIVTAAEPISLARPANS